MRAHTHVYKPKQGAAAERRSGMTAGQVVDVEEGMDAEDEEYRVVALRDAAGAVPDVLIRIRASTTSAQVSAVS